MSVEQHTGAMLDASSYSFVHIRSLTFVSSQLWLWLPNVGNAQKLYLPLEQRWEKQQNCIKQGSTIDNVLVSFFMISVWVVVCCKSMIAFFWSFTSICMRKDKAESGYQDNLMYEQGTSSNRDWQKLTLYEIGWLAKIICLAMCW